VTLYYLLHQVSAILVKERKRLLTKPKIKINYKRTKQLKQLLFNKIWPSRKGETHRSDTIHCLVRPFCREIGIEARPIAYVVESWLIGDILHKIIQSLFPLKEKEFIEYGIFAHVDFIWDSLPAEIKTTINAVTKPSHTLIYMDDITSGFSFANSNKGYLITFSLVEKILLVWDITFPKADIPKIKLELYNRKLLLEQAVRTKNFELLEPLYDECVWCPYNYLGGCPYSLETD
jgi:hypothetical protein